MECLGVQLPFIWRHGISHCRHWFFFMGIDWITGGILLPVIFKKVRSQKMADWRVRAGWKGLCRKGMTLLFVLIAVRLDLLMGTNYLRDAVCIAFIANEALSILEKRGIDGDAHSRSTQTGN